MRTWNFNCLLRCALLTFLTGLSFTSSGQIFAPFSTETKALYSSWPQKGPTSSLAIEDTTHFGNQIIFQVVKTWLHDNTIPPNTELVVDTICEISTSAEAPCYPVTVPHWFGPRIVKVSQHAYDFYSGSEDTLHFDFDMAQGDSTLIYATNEASIFMIYEGSTTATYLNFTDSVANYRLAHLSQSGPIMNSPLHNAPVIIGKQLGIIHFFRMDIFPEILQTVQIIGHAGTESGLYVIKAKDIHDFNVGDIFQYKFEDGGNITEPFSSSYITYTTKTVLSRTDTENEIIYSILEESTKINYWNQWVDTTFSTSTSTLTIDLNEIYAQIPLGSHEPEVHYTFKSLNFVHDSCGGRWQYAERESDWELCNNHSVSCYANNFYTFGQNDPYFLKVPYVYQFGRGLISSNGGFNVFGTGFYDEWNRELIYSSKNGLECGDQWILSTNTPAVSRGQLGIYPNPAKSVVHLRHPLALLTLATLHDMQGREVLVASLQHSEPVMDVSTLTSGMYLLRAFDSAGRVYMEKLVVE